MCIVRRGNYSQPLPMPIMYVQNNKIGMSISVQCI